jgi:gamma-glutamylcyclotransferase (GGCT)/AIG2-like uncharacterized protein YtfP
MIRLRLFVYGSLKRGYANHDRYCRGVHSMEEAQIEGSLFQMPTGYPVLRLSKDRILAAGSGDLLDDLKTQRQLNANPSGKARPAGTFPHSRSQVQGTILTFGDALERLRAIDSLEEFRPGRRSRYERVLVEVYSRIAQSQETVWTYIAGELSPRGKRIPTGKWTGWLS